MTTLFAAGDPVFHHGVGWAVLLIVGRIETVVVKMRHRHFDLVKIELKLVILHADF